MRFDEIFDYVLKLEGGFVLHRNETEEADTYAGIYRKAHPNWLGWTYLDEEEIPPESLVREFYEEQFWEPIEVHNELVKGLIFEYGMNAGLATAIKTAQRVAGAKEDGQIGPKTEAALKELSDKEFVALFSMERAKYYLGLANKNNRKYGMYLRGWMNRVFDSATWFSDKFNVR